MPSWVSVTWCRWSLLALIVLQGAWFGWLNPPTAMPIAFVLTAMMGPLVLVFWGVWQNHTRAMVIGGFILLFHFSLAVSEAYASAQVRGLALLQIALICIYFTGLLAVRRKKSPD